MRKLKMTAAAVLAAATVSVSIPAVPEYFSEIGSISEVHAEDANFIYREYDDHVEITGCDQLAEEVIIPAEINGLPVTVINGWVFENCFRLVSISIPDSVTAIYDYAFSGCSSLESITIPDSVTYIGYNAFYNCKSLTSIAIPDGVTSIRSETFYGCTSLTSITIPDSVIIIGDGTFAGCSSLESITIPESVISIGFNVFYGCSGMTSIDVAENNSYYCSSEGILFDKDKTSLIKYPAVTAETEYIVPDSVTSIGERAFEDCSGLTSITIPDSVTSIGGNAFSGCSGLTEINVDENNTAYYSYDGSLYKYAYEEHFYGSEPYAYNALLVYPMAKQGEYTIKDGTEKICAWAFEDCTGVTAVNMPESVTSIGERVFAGCTGLKSIDIPAGVTEIGEAFSDGCTSLEEINVDSGNTVYYSHEGVLYKNKEELEYDYSVATGPYEYEIKTYKTLVAYPEGKQGGYTVEDGTECIGNYAFEHCPKLTSINIPASVIYVGYYFCDDCTALEEISVDRQNTVYYSYDGALCRYAYQRYDDEKTYNAVLAYPPGKQGGYTVKNGTERIANLAFENCEYLESVKIPESVELITPGNETISNGCEKELYYSHYYKHNYYFNGTIYGYNNTAAHIYAAYSGYNFESMGDAPVYQTGDVNGDSMIDATDASAILVEYAYASTSIYSEFSNAQKTAGDIDGDGKVDSTDASKVLMYYSYLSTGGEIKDMNQWLQSVSI